MQRKQHAVYPNIFPPVFLVSEEGCKVFLSEVGPILLDEQGNALGEFADSKAYPIEPGDFLIVIGDWEQDVSPLTGRVGRA
jgi:hypothetical protein